MIFKRVFGHECPQLLSESLQTSCVHVSLSFSGNGKDALTRTIFVDGVPYEWTKEKVCAAATRTGWEIVIFLHQGQCKR